VGKKISVLIVSLFLLAFSSSPASALVFADSKTITPDGDASFFSKFPTETFGTVPYFSVLNNSTGIVWSWLHFNLSTIPDGATITSATLKLYVSSSGQNVSGTVIKIYQNTVDAYSESATWNAVALGGPLLPNTLNYNGTSTVEASVTDAVKAWWAGTAANKGLVLTTSTPGGYTMFQSREGANRPTLLVNYTTPLNINVNLISTPTPTQTPQVQATPTPTPTLAPSQTPTPTTIKTKPTPTTLLEDTTLLDSGNPDGTIQEPTPEPIKNENKLTFSISANMVVAALMVLAGLILVILFIWLLKKKAGKGKEQATDETEEKKDTIKEEKIEDQPKTEESPKENEEK
jgi:hypothetical protein